MCLKIVNFKFSNVFLTTPLSLFISQLEVIESQTFILNKPVYAKLG